MCLWLVKTEPSVISTGSETEKNIIYFYQGMFQSILEESF